MRMIVLLHVRVENTQQFRVNRVKVFAHDDGTFFGFERDNVHNLGKHFVPNQRRVAAQHGHVNFIVNVADTIRVRMFLTLHRHAFVVLEFAWTVLLDETQHLTVLAYPRGSIEDQVAEIGQFARHLKSCQFRVQIELLNRSDVLFKLRFVKLHGCVGCWWIGGTCV